MRARGINEHGRRVDRKLCISYEHWASIEEPDDGVKADFGRLIPRARGIEYRGDIRVTLVGGRSSTL